MTWVPVALVLGVLVVLGTASLPYGVEPLEDLYRLNRLYDHDDPYMALLPLDDVDSRSDDGVEGVDDSLWAGTDVDTSLYNSPLYSETQVRDQEHLEHSALQGLHAVAGGTAEGQPPQKQVKTDKPLPAYCNPPNPCPVGKTAADNCVENFENSMDNNKEILAHQDCPCDTEHMFHCPAGQQTVTSKGVGGQAAFSKVMSELAQLNADDDLTLANNPYLAQGVKREKLVAKKSPSLLRHKRSQEEMDYNPYLQGRMLETAAKKSPEMIVH
ncbi:hypothetical protein C0Q70_14446 [Pomacea canaliculata]|uniref:Neuroendocrine protein 7B2 n=1 Tax=Pomacea canaliculata TaxID=400727 RepID=A0A2T7P010_POMCA|nr:hypothetical protein C0Q70_14446 [Pomacea canaliculata]